MSASLYLPQLIPHSQHPSSRQAVQILREINLATRFKLVKSPAFYSTFKEQDPALIFAIRVLSNVCTVQGTVVGSRNNVSSVTELLAADPSAANPLIGYQIIQGPLTSSQLVPGQTLNTTDTLKQFGSPDRTLAVTIPAANQVHCLK